MKPEDLQACNALHVRNSLALVSIRSRDAYGRKSNPSEDTTERSGKTGRGEEQRDSSLSLSAPVPHYNALYKY